MAESRAPDRVGVMRRIRIETGAEGFEAALAPLDSLTRAAAGFDWQVSIRSVRDTNVFFQLTGWNSIAAFRDLARQKRARQSVGRLSHMTVDLGTVMELHILQPPQVIVLSPGFVVMCPVTGPSFDDGTIERIRVRMASLSNHFGFGGSAVLRNQSARSSSTLLCWLHLTSELDAEHFGVAIREVLVSLPNLVVSEVIVARHISWMVAPDADD